MTQEPPEPASHWSHSQLAKELADMGISASQIGRILADLDRNTAANFIAFLDDLDAKVPAALQVHLVLKGPRHPLVVRSPPALPPALPPSHASWLNQVELFFSILARRLLKRGEFASVEDLVGKVLAFIADYNRTATPFRWTYDGRPLKAS